MTPTLVQKLQALAAPANPSPEKMDDIIHGWDDLFFRLGLKPDEEEAEFDAIMRARVSVGVISIVADRFCGQDARVTRLGGAFMPKPAFDAPNRLSESATSMDARPTKVDQG